MKPVGALLTVLLLSLGAVDANASSTFRCRSKLVSLQATTAEVAAKCGEPSARAMTGYREIIDDYGFRQEVPVEEWTYGPTNGMYHFLRFEGNRLTRIDSERQ
ncbi:DUF2845 domain-containing protein [Stutzerimonas stutzeri]|uniref:DUF2845 domain-containing protein n=1 Tax=Stutzerimonas stutzeri TaxID=316 RepID=UPI001C2E3ADD|nr:DUF2845 domain-containing protein [Stutzerimonas stutzeri]